jgi:hypothetical protein
MKPSRVSLAAVAQGSVHSVRVLVPGAATSAHIAAATLITDRVWKWLGF